MRVLVVAMVALAQETGWDHALDYLKSLEGAVQKVITPNQHSLVEGADQQPKGGDDDGEDSGAQVLRLMQADLTRLSSAQDLLNEATDNAEQVAAELAKHEQLYDDVIKAHGKYQQKKESINLSQISSLTEMKTALAKGRDALIESAKAAKSAAPAIASAKAQAALLQQSSTSFVEIRAHDVPTMIPTYDDTKDKAELDSDLREMDSVTSGVKSAEDKMTEAFERIPDTPMSAQDFDMKDGDADPTLADASLLQVGSKGDISLRSQK